jgi:hypothetical protein
MNCQTGFGRKFWIPIRIRNTSEGYPYAYPGRGKNIILEEGGLRWTDIWTPAFLKTFLLLSVLPLFLPPFLITYLIHYSLLYVFKKIKFSSLEN